MYDKLWYTIILYMEFNIISHGNHDVDKKY